MAAKQPSQMNSLKLKSLIRDIPDFPKKGIVFKDITPLLKDPGALKFACHELARKFKGTGAEQVVAVESRGFIFGTAVACELGAGFIPVRKPNKLPAAIESISYSLEYGKDSLEVHCDAIAKNTRVLIVDDLLATGGTAEAVIRLIEKLGGVVVGVVFLVELTFLKGRERLKNYPVHSLITF